MEQNVEANVNMESSIHPVQPGGKRLAKDGKKGWIVLAVVLALLVCGYLGCCAYADSLDTFYPNYAINGIDVGGLPVDEAQSRLEAELLTQGIEVTNDTLDTQLTITVADLGYTAADFADDAQFWMEDLKRDGFLEKGWTFLNFLIGRYPGGANWPDMDQETLNSTSAFLAEFFSEEPIDGSYEISDNAIVLTRAKDGRSVGEAEFRAALEDIASYSKDGYRVQVSCELVPAKTFTVQELYDKLSGEVKNAAYDIETGSIIPEQVGVEFSVEAAQAAINGAEAGEKVSVTASITEPDITAAQLEELLFRDVLAEYTTKVSGTTARRGNVKLSASAINGYVMNPGDVFSYNEAVGQRTAANGYQPAPAYVKGETVDEIGGGICQTSSTLYMTCLLANMEITERYAHRYAPAYITLGMDATVSWGGPDYKFTNNTEYPIRIETVYENHKLTVRLHGTKLDDTYSKMTYEYLGKTDWETVYQEDATVAPGTQTVKTDPYTGHKVKTYHTIYAGDGTVIDSHYEATSDYKSRNKVILVAPGELPGTEAPVTDVPAVETIVPADPAAPAQPAAPDQEPPAETPPTETVPDVTQPEATVPTEGEAL